MGRKAKLKQQRRQQRTSPDPHHAEAQPEYKDTDFVEQLEQQGYPSLGGEHAPEIPEPRSKS